MSKGFDLAALEQTDTHTFPILHPQTGEEIGATATVYGQDSAEYKKASARLADQCAEYSRRNRGKVIPNEEYSRLTKKRDVACTKSIDGLLYQGEPLKDVEDIFTRFPWVHEQVVQDIHDRAGFIKGLPAK